MGKSATITMTRLKNATNIADNRLSAHHPNGTGNETAFGDFLVFDLGAEGSDTTLDYRLFGYEVRGTVYSGSYNSNDVWTYNTSISPISDGDQFSCLIGLDRPGQYVTQQILSLQNGPSDFVYFDVNRRERCVVNSITQVQTSNFRLYPGGNSFDSDQALLIDCTADESAGSADRVEVALTYDAPLNDDMPHNRDALVFRTKNVSFAASFGGSIYARDYIYNDSVQVLYNVEDGQQPYDYQIFVSVNGGAYQQVFSETGASREIQNEEYRDFNAANGGIAASGDTVKYKIDAVDAQSQTFTEFTQTVTMP